MTRNFTILTEETPNIDEIKLMLSAVGVNIPTSTSNDDIVPNITYKVMPAVGGQKIRKKFKGVWSLDVDDLIITIYENKLLRNYDDGDVEYTRVKTKAENYKNTFTMRYDHKKYPKENYFVFHRKSGRLENVRRVNNHQRLFLYNCSIFKGPIF